MKTWFTFWPMKNIFRKLWANESSIMACLQIYRELLSLATFLRVHSNLEEVSYPNLKTTSHIKVKFFLWTKLVENLFIAKYVIYVAAPLIAHIWQLQTNNKHINFCIHSCLAFKLLSRKVLIINRDDNRNRVIAKL